MTDAAAPITRFDFASGPLRGTTLTLFPGCIVHRGGSQLETIPVAGIAAARVGFERDPGRIGWGVGLLLVGAILIALSDPLASLAGAAAGEMATQLKNEATAGGQGVARVVQATFRFLETLARALPVAGYALLAWGAVLGALGWLGRTTLTLTLAAVERDYAVRGRSPMLFDFAEMVSERLVQRSR